MNTSAAVTVRVKRSFSASPQRVFEAWLDPQWARQFLFATPTGEMVRCYIDPRVGGRFTLTDRREGEDVEHVGEYREIARQKRLVFSFQVPKYSPLSTTVALDFTPRENGCDLTLTHEGVLPEWAASTEQGWKMILDKLAELLAQNS